MPRAGIFASARVETGGEYHAAVMADSPMAYYPLGEASAPPVDATGNTSASALSSYPTFGAAGLGDAATAAAFNGSTTAILFTKPGSFSGTALTVEAIIKPSSVGGVIRQICSRGGSGTAQSHQFRVETSGKVGFIKVPVAIKSAVGATVLSAATTYHVAGVYDGADLRVYVNGSLDGGPTAATGSIDYNADGFAIGRIGATVSNDYFDGGMAGVAVYPVALSAARILAHAQAAGVA